MSMSTTTFSHDFRTEVFKQKVSFPTGIFINGKFSAGSEGSTIDVINPTNGKVITSVSRATTKDVDAAVAAAKQAFETSWGLNIPGSQRGEYLSTLANLMKDHQTELAAIEAFNNGKTFKSAMEMDVRLSIETIRYYAGWADKIQGQVIEIQQNKRAFTSPEPFGVVGQIIPSNFPLLNMCWKLGPALVTGNCVVLKPSELTPLTALRMCSLINEAGFPPGVVNVVTGEGHTIGEAIAAHVGIDKVAFTGSTHVGRQIMSAAANSNLKDVTLELGGRSPNLVFEDANLDEAVNHLASGIFLNHGQTCCGGSRIFVQSRIYDEFLNRFTDKTKSLKFGDPFASESEHSPQLSKSHYNQIMDCIESAKSQGAAVRHGGERHGTEGFWVKPTIITNTRPEMDIVREEISGPVAIIIKFEREDEVLALANDPHYGLTASLWTNDLTRGFRVTKMLQAGTVWVNCMNELYPNVPYGGFKQSGVGRECGQYALNTYTNIKSTVVNLPKSVA